MPGGWGAAVSGVLFVAQDGRGDLTVWRDNPERPGFPIAIVSEYEVGAEVWSLILAGIGAGAALADWDEWNPFHGSYREAAARLRELIAEPLCPCGKPSAHLGADPDSSEWACRVPVPGRAS